MVPRLLLSYFSQLTSPQRAHSLSPRRNGSKPADTIIRSINPLFGSSGECNAARSLVKHGFVSRLTKLQSDLSKMVLNERHSSFRSTYNHTSRVIWSAQKLTRIKCGSEALQLQDSPHGVRAAKLYDKTTDSHRSPGSKQSHPARPPNKKTGVPLPNA